MKLAGPHGSSPIDRARRGDGERLGDPSRFLTIFAFAQLPENIVEIELAGRPAIASHETFTDSAIWRHGRVLGERLFFNVLWPRSTLAEGLHANTGLLARPQSDCLMMTKNKFLIAVFGAALSLPAMSLPAISAGLPHADLPLVECDNPVFPDRSGRCETVLASLGSQQAALQAPVPVAEPNSLLLLGSGLLALAARRLRRTGA
jgi:hypothetical protein